MVVIKRDGREVSFSKRNIFNAIQKAFEEVAQTKPVGNATEIAKLITDRLYSRYKSRNRAISVEEIQDDVEIELMREKAYEVARAYIRYRHEHEMMRNGSSVDGKVLAIVDGVNEEVIQENSNKNPTILSTQRDYIAGEVSRDISNRLLLPDEIRKAHEEGIIHFHDADYYVQRMHNCFTSATRFVTDEGVVAFRDCVDGEKVNVLCADGQWREATVHNYEPQKMYNVELKSGRTTKVVTCTKDHRWILKDGTVTTNLSVGDTLYPLNKLSTMGTERPISKRNCEMFALGMIIGDGVDKNTGTNSPIFQIRLCGDKVQHKNVFEKAGYKFCSIDGSDDIVAHKPSGKYGFTKQQFLDGSMWKCLSAEDKRYLFMGYYAADGCKDRNMCHTADDRVAQMIRDISAVYGAHIISEKEIIRDTPYKQGARLIQFSFIVSQPANWCWKVMSITQARAGDYKHETWCVEEPVTHSFTLDGGIVTGNCCLVNLEDMLQNGTVISGTKIIKPHSFSTACNIATQIIAQVASNQYGGQSISLAHLAPFVDVSRQKIRADVEHEVEAMQSKSWDVLDDAVKEQLIHDLTEERVREEVKRGVQTIQYQVITLMTTNGQAPFITVFMYLNEVPDGQLKDDLAMVIEETVRQRYQGVQNEKGVWITPAFPKLIYVLEEDNVTPDGKYWYLTKLCAECSAKRLVPDYISEKIMLLNKVDKNGEGHCYTCMGCRSFLTPYIDENGKPKYYGRFNQGVVTINLPDVGLSARQKMIADGIEYENDAQWDRIQKEYFWQIFEDRLELCHRALRLRHERLLGTLSDASPIHWQNGALARLKKGEKIDKLLYGGYSTLSLGYAGLYECVKAMTGKSHTDEVAKPFALEIMQYMNDKCKQWKEAENIDYSLYGTPIESTTYKFAKCLQKRFGVIEGITDKGYITNSYHVHVTEPIDAFEKLRFEAEFQLLSPGGAISYVETANLSNNIEAVLAVIRYIYDHIMYAELNTKSDFCQVCGYDGEINIVENDDGKLVWECPNCGNRNKSKMNIARRTCGLTK